MKRKIVHIEGYPYYADNLQPVGSTGKKIWKGLAKVGEGVIAVGKFAGKQVGNAARNYSEQQRRAQQPPQHGKKKSGQPQPQRSPFPESGFGF